ncbi:MAG TPA: low molecular weight protein-tyrosine-phosphatase [Burkholderiales bacterium]|nr:low molecular weight protein-tyrosine-phosphatase [Burkholderiales bacterium]
MTQKRSVLFVCTGNICRSVTAEGVFRKMVRDVGLEGHFHIDSAGTQGYHVGDEPDLRSQHAARKRGYDLSPLRARKVEKADFERFDLILAMDDDHHRVLSRLAPPAHAHKLKMMLSYAKECIHREVPDPYYGGPDGFELVLDLLENASAELLNEIRAELEASSNA